MGDRGAHQRAGLLEYTVRGEIRESQKVPQYGRASAWRSFTLLGLNFKKKGWKICIKVSVPFLSYFANFQEFKDSISEIFAAGH